VPCPLRARSPPSHPSLSTGRLALQLLDGQLTESVGDGNALAVEVNLFRHTYNTLRAHQALDERTPRAAYLAVEHCD
jgi:hypothetical protein